VRVLNITSLQITKLRQNFNNYSLLLELKLLIMILDHNHNRGSQIGFILNTNDCDNKIWSKIGVFVCFSIMILLLLLLLLLLC
jgi:hypothetical protein